jgi:hypothetical protein
MDGTPRVERLFWTRLRWRLRGAWLWPTFFALLVVDGLVLTLLPPYGDDGPGDLWGAMLLAGFANLFIVAALAPLGARLLRRLRPQLPRLIAVDYTGTALLCLFAAALLLAGVSHRSAVAAARADEDAVAVAVHAYINRSAAEHRPFLSGADSMRLEPELYRACVPGPDPKRWLCLFVSTRRLPAAVKRASDRAPNAVYRGWRGFE